MQTVERICISHTIIKLRKYYRHPTSPWRSVSLRHIDSRSLTPTKYIQYPGNPGNWKSEREALFPPGLEMRFRLQMASQDTLPFYLALSWVSNASLVACLHSDFLLFRHTTLSLSVHEYCWMNELVLSG